jgi:uncharacterized protein YkwD
MLKAAITAALLVSLTACVTPSGNGGRPGDGTTVIRMSRIGADKVQYRHVDAVNAIRQSRGLAPVELNASLITAAQRHAADISAQNRPWHFGSNGSSPLDRVATAGYAGTFVGENISETFEDDFNTLDVWMNDPLAAASILDAQAKQMGIAYHQDGSGKLWWVQVFGG